jgi:8-oxo-dGTP pyrophosphatase MutT (NUDIX family)
MKRAEFKKRFLLTQLSSERDGYCHNGHLKKAGVLIGLVDSPKGLEVLLTERAHHLKHHGGQISFPGGRYEEDDHSVIHTALREAEEEINLQPETVEVLGQLNIHHTVSGYQVSPIVALLPANLKLTPDPNEVETIFQVPLSHFIDRNNHKSVSIMQGSQQHNVYFMPYLSYNIWGATAAMLKDLVEHIS